MLQLRLLLSSCCGCSVQRVLLQQQLLLMLLCSVQRGLLQRQLPLILLLQLLQQLLLLPLGPKKPLKFQLLAER